MEVKIIPLCQFLGLRSHSDFFTLVDVFLIDQTLYFLIVTLILAAGNPPYLKVSRTDKLRGQSVHMVIAPPMVKNVKFVKTSKRIRKSVYLSQDVLEENGAATLAEVFE
jgi:hypothetical protein